MKIVVVVPTYNEAENIGRLIDALAVAFKNIPQHEMCLLVVDGNSPDGTAEVVRNKSAEYPWAHLLLEENKAGIGAAYFCAFKYAIHELGAEVIVEMDGDFQHDPQELIDLIKPFSEGYDYVIGSRFVKGGGIPREWAFYRKFLSIGGSVFSKVVLGIYNVDDFTTGFKASRVRGFLEKIDFDTIKTKSFAYKIDLLFRMHKLGAKIKQVPIQFGLRDRGTSKIEGGTFFDSLKTVIQIRLEDSKSFIRFCAVGFMGLFVDAGLFNLMSISLFKPHVSAILSGFVAMITTFALNNSWSFGDRRKQQLGQLLQSFPVYGVFSTIPILLRSKLVDYSILTFGQNSLVYNTAFFIGVLFGLIWNYVVYSKIVWRKQGK